MAEMGWAGCVQNTLFKHGCIVGCKTHHILPRRGSYADVFMLLKFCESWHSKTDRRGGDRGLGGAVCIAKGRIGAGGCGRRPLAVGTFCFGDRKSFNFIIAENHPNLKSYVCMPGNNSKGGLVIKNSMVHVSFKLERKRI